MRAYWIIIRPLNVTFAVFSLLITADIIHRLSITLTLIMAGGVIAAFTAAGNIMNDIFDLPIDKINRPERPMVSGRISRSAAIGYATVLFLLGGCGCLWLNPAARNLALIVILPTLLLYTPIFKKIPLTGNALVAALLGTVFIFSEIALMGRADKMWFPAGLAFGLTFIRELVKDMEDIAGDGKLRIKTFPVRYGMVTSYYVLIAATVILCMYAVVPYFMGRFGYVYYGLLVCGVELPLLLSLGWLSKKITALRCSTVSMVLKFCTLTGLAVIWSIKLY